MKKYSILIVLLILSYKAFSQKIDKSEVDDFTGKKAVYTSYEKIKGSMNCKNILHFRLISESEKEYMQLKWSTDRMLSVSEGENVLLKLSNNDILKCKNLKYVLASNGDGAVGLNCSKALGVCLDLSIENIEIFKSNDVFVTKIRIQTSEGYFDIDIKEKDSKKLNKAYSLLSNELKK